MSAARVVDVRGIPIRYEEFGEGRPALFIHGVVTDRRHVVAEFEPAFAGRSGWRRLYPDLPGRGETPAADWIQSQDDILDVALEFLDAVAPGQRFIVGGSSWGGYIALGVIHRRAADLDGAVFVVTNPLREGRTVAEHQVLVRDEAVVASLAEDEKGWVNYATVQTAETLRFERELIAPAIEAADMPFIERVEERTAFTFDVRELARSTARRWCSRDARTRWPATLTCSRCSTRFRARPGRSLTAAATAWPTSSPCSSRSSSPTGSTASRPSGPRPVDPHLWVDRWLRSCRPRGLDRRRLRRLGAPAASG